MVIQSKTGRPQDQDIKMERRLKHIACAQVLMGIELM